jgi:phage shock protein C
MNENGKRLTRTRDGRMIAGVCSGVAAYFGVDATIVRVVLAAVTLLTGGTGILLYVAAALIVPDEGKETSIAQDLINKQTNKGNSDIN